MITIPTYTGKADDTYLRTLTDTLKQIQRDLTFLIDLITVDSDGIVHFTLKGSED